MLQRVQFVQTEKWKKSTSHLVEHLYKRRGILKKNLRLGYE